MIPLMDRSGLSIPMFGQRQVTGLFISSDNVLSKRTLNLQTLNHNIMPVNILSPVRQRQARPDGSDAISDISPCKALSPHATTSVRDLGPLILTDGDLMRFNLRAVAWRFADTHTMAFDDQLKAFFRFDAEAGIWVKIQASKLPWLCGQFLNAIADEAKELSLLAKINPATIRSILDFLKGCAQMGETTQLHSRLLPVANGVLDLSGTTPVLLPYRREYWFTSKIDFAYAPNCRCTRFVNELVAPALANPDDLCLVQRLLGSLLLKGNAAQRIFVIYGPGSSGKSTLLSLMETMIGRCHFADLRTDANSRFETSYYRGRSVLVAKDEKPDFLARPGAAMLKRLTGGDWIETEEKFGGKDGLQEAFHVLISANTRLPIAINDDASAWRRRILPIHFDRSAPERKIPRFDEELLREEGEGILAWLITGYLAHKRDLDELGDFRLTEAQQARINDWVLESQSQRHFVETSIVKGSGTLSGAEIYEAYVTACISREWKPIPAFHFDRALASTMAEVHGLAQNHDIKRNGKSVRGFKGVTTSTTSPTVPVL